ncbi:SDR family NAD(P)-dependent oxidoreductase [Kribbella sp. NPDC049227]|uniref:SDR family NAD(P)-dependent oxidoreductase n=1 Tax=Kribbella sp. NPDC049227 TaxID=3364113 RepID=UPI003714115D
MSAGAVAIVTGAGGGIGAAVCHRLTLSGWSVVAVDIDPDAVACTGDRCLSLRADVTDTADVQHMITRTVSELGSLDTVVNAAGVEGAVRRLDEYPEDAFDQVMRVNVRGVFLVMKHAFPALRGSKRASIVNIASTSGIRGRANLAAYVASKHAVVGLTRTAALERPTSGVRVNAVLPGPIDTRMIHAIESAGTGIDRAGPASMGQPEDVAHVVEFLASAASRHVNGATWVVDDATTAA